MFDVPFNKRFIQFKTKLGFSVFSLITQLTYCVKEQLSSESHGQMRLEQDAILELI